MAEHCDGINDSGFDAKLKEEETATDVETKHNAVTGSRRVCVQGVDSLYCLGSLGSSTHCSALSLPRLLPRIPVPAFLHVGTGTNSTGRNFWPQKNSSVGLPAKPQKQKRCLPLPPPANPIFIARLTRILARLERVGQLGRHGGGSFGSLVLLLLSRFGSSRPKCAEQVSPATYVLYVLINIVIRKEESNKLNETTAQQNNKPKQR